MKHLVCGYRAVQTLDLNIQGLFLFEQILQLFLSRVQGLAVFGLHHLDVFKLEKDKQDGNGEIKRSNENNMT